MENGNYTKEEIIAAKEIRDSIIESKLPESLKTIYMAGEIVMWDELKSKGLYTEKEMRDALEFAFKLDPKTGQYIKNNGFDAYIKLIKK